MADIEKKEPEEQPKKISLWMIVTLLIMLLLAVAAVFGWLYVRKVNREEASRPSESRQEDFPNLSDTDLQSVFDENAPLTGMTNGAGNAQNLGFALAIPNGDIFFCTVADGIFCENSEGERTKISENAGLYLMYEEPYLYYLNLSDRRTVWRMKTDGTEAQLFLDRENLWELSISSGTIFFKEDGMLKSVSTADPEKLQEYLRVGSYSVNQEYLYYMDYDGYGTLYSMELSSKKTTELDPLMVGKVFSSGKWVYYTVSDTAAQTFGMFTCRTGGTKKTALSSTEGTCLNYYNGRLYYAFQNELRWIDVSTLEKTYLTTEKAAAICIAGDWIFYYNFDYAAALSKGGVYSPAEGEGLGRMRLKGDDNELISN